MRTTLLMAAVAAAVLTVCGCKDAKDKPVSAADATDTAYVPFIVPAITGSHGNITLHLPPQSYQNAEIALHSVNGRLVLRGKAAAPEAGSAISCRNAAAGVYLLSINGINGSAFTTRLIHSGGNLNINVTFKNKSKNKSDNDNENESESVSTDPQLERAAADKEPLVYTFVDSRDGKVYRQTVIGRQIWMAENLNYAAKGSKCYGEGGKVVTDWDKNDKPITTKLSNAEVRANCDRYGRLYNWPTAKTACPDGWHLPTEAEWTTLMKYAGGSLRAGKKLKSETDWDEPCILCGTGTDEYGFSALPGGFGVSGGGFGGDGIDGAWWSATENDTTYAWVRGVSYDSERVDRIKIGKKDLFSVRCVEDGPETAATDTSVNTAPSAAFTDSRDGQTYRKVAIGTQTWMAENLNYDVPDDTMDVCYNNSADSCAKYGRLYDWNTAIKACPAGWHLPSEAEWDTLEEFVGGWFAAGTELKTTTGWKDDGNGLDEYGFSALPGGHGGSDGSFGYIGSWGTWWSATEDKDEADLVLVPSIYHNWGVVNGGYYKVKTARYSVRCLAD